MPFDLLKKIEFSCYLKRRNDGPAQYTYRTYETSAQVLLHEHYYSYSVIPRGLVHCPLKPVADFPLADPVVADEGQAGSRPLFCPVSATDTQKKGNISPRELTI